MELGQLVVAKMAAERLLEDIDKFETDPCVPNEEDLFVATAGAAREAFKLFDELKERHDNRVQ